MPKISPAKIYEFRSQFRAPLPFVYAWCTDYTPHDAQLEGDDYIRRIVRRSAHKVVFEDLNELPSGWTWSHYEVDLRPPNRWHAEAVGSHRTWSIDYVLTSRGPGITELWFKGRRRATELAGENPPKAKFERELRGMWKRFGRALERDYRASLKRARRK
jgi:hypothetical protein